MWQTSDCPLCGGRRYENDHGVMCNTNECPCRVSYPGEDLIIWGWNKNPKFMEKNEKYYIEQWNLMGKNYVKWLKDNGKSRKAHDNIADEVIIKDGSSITLKNGTKITFKRGEGQSKYTGIMEVNGEGGDAEEVHFWLENKKGRIIYDGSDYKCKEGDECWPYPPPPSPPPKRIRKGVS